MGLLSTRGYHISFTQPVAAASRTPFALQQTDRCCSANVAFLQHVSHPAGFGLSRAQAAQEVRWCDYGNFKDRG
ncbi:MAG: hypothetical protein ACK48U_03280, partial [Planctomyces sp.]